MHPQDSAAYKLNDHLELGYQSVSQDTSDQHDDIHQFVDSYPEGIVFLTPVHNKHGAVADFVYSYINKTAEKMLNRSKKEMLGQKLLEVFPRTDSQGIFDIYVNVFTSGKSSTFQFHYPYEGFNNWFRQKIEKFENGILVHTIDLSNTSEPLQERLISEV